MRVLDSTSGLQSSFDFVISRDLKQYFLGRSAGYRLPHLAWLLRLSSICLPLLQLPVKIAAVCSARQMYVSHPGTRHLLGLPRSRRVSPAGRPLCLCRWTSYNFLCLDSFPRGEGAEQRWDTDIKANASCMEDTNKRGGHTKMKTSTMTCRLSQWLHLKKIRAGVGRADNGWLLGLLIGREPD